MKLHSFDGWLCCGDDDLDLGRFGLLTASVACLCLYITAKRRFAESFHKRRHVALEIASAPFLALLWLVLAFIIHVFISNGVAHQDCGLSGDPYVTLPNGYILGSHNTYDGYIKAPGFETDVPVAGPGYVRSIIDLQLQDGVFSGTQLELKTSKMRSFVFDMRTRTFRASAGEDLVGEGTAGYESKELAAFGAAMTRAHTDSNSYWKMYQQYRRPWPNYVLSLLILVGEIAIPLWTKKIWITATRINSV